MSFQVVNSNPIPIIRNSIASPPVVISPPPATLGWVSDWMEMILKKISTNAIGPTFATRWLFVAANMVYNSYQFVTSSKTPVDFSYWKTYSKGLLISDVNVLNSWMEIACQFAFPLLIRNYMKVILSQAEVDTLVLKHRPLVAINQDSMNTLQQLISAYLLARDSDGWKQTTAFSGNLPNGNQVIYADNTVNQDLKTELPEPEKWTPLSIGGRVRKYLTPEWGTVNKGVLFDADFLEMLSEVSQLFPNSAQFQKENEEVKSITALLTPQQKMIAEYWAGGPGTVTPPGMWMVFLDVVIRSNGLTLQQEIRNYTIVASGLYQAGISAWRLKRDHMQARPVQMLRESQYNEPIDQAWNDQHLGQYWLPYQELNFVTPPFPDFVSGHSTFASTCAKLFCYLFQTDQVNLVNPVISLDILNYFSPILNSQTLNFSINSIFLKPRCSKIEASQPPTGISMGWSTWSDMALSCGESRIFGGIHVESSNQGGLYLGRLIGDKIWEKFKNL